jgi:hypothetical protein
MRDLLGDLLGAKNAGVTLNLRNVPRRRRKVLDEGYNCVMCQNMVEETMDHLFFESPSASCRWFSLGIVWADNHNVH